MDADKRESNRRKELEVRKDYSLSASIGERAGERCRIWSLNNQLSTVRLAKPDRELPIRQKVSAECRIVVELPRADIENPPGKEPTDVLMSSLPDGLECFNSFARALRPSMALKIIIAGGGVGGLTLAVALRRRGVRVT